MSHRQNSMFWAFSLGSWCGIRVRVSWFMPLVLVWMLYEFQWRLGGVLFGVLFATVLLHEVGHIVAGQAMDGSGDEILIWPLGGLAFVDSSSTPRAQFVTAAGGPLVNLLLFGIFL